MIESVGTQPPSGSEPEYSLVGYIDASEGDYLNGLDSEWEYIDVTPQDKIQIQ